jgi:hypothetical protein
MTTGKAAASDIANIVLADRRGLALVWLAGPPRLRTPDEQFFDRV